MSYVPTKQVFSFAEEFKNFLFKGNMIDMAIGIVIGGAFTKLVGSLVANVIMPFVGVFTTINAPPPKPAPAAVAPAKPAPASADAKTEATADQMGDIFRKWKTPIRGIDIKWGEFLGELVNFIILGLVIFILMVKFVGSLTKKKRDDVVAPPPPPPDVALLTEIRDLLKANAKPEGA